MKPPKLIASDKISKVSIIQLDSYSDNRGLNFEIYNKDNKLIDFKLISASISKKGVLRGFHGQKQGYKVVQVISGQIQFVLLDLDIDSPTYGVAEEFILKDTDMKQVIIPNFVMNSHLCLSKSCSFLYFWENGYVPQNEQLSWKWNDPLVLKQIKWKIKNPILSLRDK